MVLFCAGLFAGTATAAPVILVMGDSLSASHGIDQHRGWVSLLALRLQREGFPHHVVNASVSGETTAGGLTHLGPAMARHQPAIVIIELGANDGLRGLPLVQMRSNLQKMIANAKNHGARVLLIGMRLPPNYGPRYTRSFQNTYLKLAKKNAIAVLPFLLEGISEKREWMQADNLHPSAEAQPGLLENVWPALLPLLKE